MQACPTSLRALVVLPALVLLAACAGGAPRAGGRTDTLCAPLRAFVASVGPDDARELAFHTSWGSNFKDEPGEKALFAKRCLHQGYAPAQAVCAELMESGATEFSDNNAKRAIACLSPGTGFAPEVGFSAGRFSLQSGNSDAGAFVTVEFAEDKDIGGMVLRIQADGY